MAAKPLKILDQVREVLRMKQYAYRTGQAYFDWIKRFIFFHNKYHPKEMGANEINACLSHLANYKNAAPST